MARKMDLVVGFSFLLLIITIFSFGFYIYEKFPREPQKVIFCSTELFNTFYPCNNKKDCEIPLFNELNNTLFEYQIRNIEGVKKVNENYLIGEFISNCSECKNNYCYSGISVKNSP